MLFAPTLTAITAWLTSLQFVPYAPVDTMLTRTTLANSVLLSVPPAPLTAPASLSPTQQARPLSLSTAPRLLVCVTLAARAVPPAVLQPALSASMVTTWLPTPLLVAVSSTAVPAAALAAPVRLTSPPNVSPAGLAPTSVELPALNATPHALPA